MKLRTLIAAGALLALAAPYCPADPKDKPDQPKYEGKTLDELLSRYIQSLLGRGPDHAGNIQFLPLPAGVQVGGSGTVADPAVYQGHLNVTLKKNESFALTVVATYGESYATGIPIDPEINASNFDLTEALVTLDGVPIFSKAAGERSPNYVSPQYFRPIYYDEPTSYGSIAAAFAQGIFIVNGRLSPGTHTLSLYATQFITDHTPGGDPEINPPITDFGAVYGNTWTITVK